jgi:hypothetical protein
METAEIMNMYAGILDQQDLDDLALGAPPAMPAPPRAAQAPPRAAQAPQTSSAAPAAFPNGGTVSPSRPPSWAPVVDDAVAKSVEALWRSQFRDAALLPVIGLPSNNDGVLTLTHTDGSGRLLNINGLPSKSPLSNNALYSAEVSDGRYLNLYEIMLPDIPGKPGEPSTSEHYVALLAQRGLSVAGVHFHWWGSRIFEFDHGITAVHHQAVGLPPIEFSELTIRALQGALALIEQRARERVVSPS